MFASSCRKKVSDTRWLIRLSCGETPVYSSRQALRAIYTIGIRARQCAQRNGNTKFHTKICHQNHSKSRFSLICSTLGCPTLSPMNFLEHPVCSQTCVWYSTRTTHNLGQNEHTKLELFPNNRPKIPNNFGPTVSHLAR